MDALDFMVDRDQHMRPLEYDLSENLNALLRYMQDMGILDNVPVGTTSESEIVSISDAYPAPPRALTVYGKSTQAGTPTPDAPVPILSVDLLGLWMASQAPTFLNSSADWTQGTIRTADGTTNTASNRIRSSVIPIATGKTYSIQCNSGFECSLRGYSAEPVGADTYVPADTTDFARTHTLTSLQSTKLRIVLRRSNDSRIAPENANELNVFVAESATTVPDLLPEGTSLRSLPDGTRDQLNLAYLRPSTRDGWAWYSRELTRRVDGMLLSSSANWSGGASYYNGTDGTDRYFTTDVFRRAEGINDRFALNSTMLSVPDNLNAWNIWSNPNANIWRMILYTNQMHVVFDNATIDITAETAAADRTAAIKTWLDNNPITVYYPIATPVTTTLDPIELPTLPAPNCTVWCDGGSATPTLMLEYVRNANAAIAELSEAIADIVSG